MLRLMFVIKLIFVLALMLVLVLVKGESDNYEQI